jgi:GNAT superfamily N-acetyltransferase
MDRTSHSNDPMNGTNSNDLPNVPDVDSRSCSPLEFLDAAGREVRIRPTESAERDALVKMYDALAPEDRAQGLPPATTARIESWLDDVLADGHHLAAVHDGAAVGHTFVLPGGERGHELAIFVTSTHQHAGIGTRLLDSLLADGAACGVERIWLTVRRDNVPARRLYESAGFERVRHPERDPLAGDLLMARPL